MLLQTFGQRVGKHPRLPIYLMKRALEALAGAWRSLKSPSTLPGTHLPYWLRGPRFVSAVWQWVDWLKREGASWTPSRFKSYEKKRQKKQKKKKKSIQKGRKENNRSVE